MRELTVGIVWRRDGRNNDCKGAIWDHLRFSLMLNDAARVMRVKTAIIGWNDGERAKPTDEDLERVKDGCKRRVSTIVAEEADMIIIPGVSVAGEDDNARAAAEKALIEACCGTKPMLLVCGAVYRLDGFRGLAVVDVKDHSHTKMVSWNGEKVVDNANVHFASATPAGRQIFFGEGESTAFPCNSVHNRAVLVDGMPEAFETLAVSGDVCPTQTGGVRKSRLGKPLTPTPCAECFQLKREDGHKPFVVVQWHPEAFDPDDPDQAVHRNIICFPLSEAIRAVQPQEAPGVQEAHGVPRPEPVALARALANEAHQLEEQQALPSGHD